MLDRTADPASDINFRRDHLAGLADLQRIVAVTGIAGAARGADGSAEAVCQFFQHLKAVGAFDTASSGYDDFRFGEIYLAGHLAHHVFEDDTQRCRRSELQWNDCACGRGWVSGRKVVRTKGYDSGAV
ncbi:hypothetical protein D3C74_311020 [compost metagenome]